MSMLSPAFFRIDPLTNCKNYLAFIEDLANLPVVELPPGGWVPDTEPQTSWPQDTTLLFVEINHMRDLNETHGHVFGDSVIHWLGIVLTEESGGTVYRVGGVEFVATLSFGAFAEHEQTLHRIIKRIEIEAKAIGASEPAVHTAVIHYPRLFYANPVNVLMQINEAMLILKSTPNTIYKVFMGKDLKVADLSLKNWVEDKEHDPTYRSRWIARRNVQQSLWMGKKLDQIQAEAYTDAISGLPNIKAALDHLEKALQNSITNHKSFSLLLIDGDNIRAYNSINYAAGDEMIRDMCAVFKSNLRPNDFVARWRSGDEFVVILPDTSSTGAKIIGDRFRVAVKEASQTWRFPVTISIGSASYPTHGEDVNSLIDKAESANKRAKDQGKDQVVLAD